MQLVLTNHIELNHRQEFSIHVSHAKKGDIP